MKLLIIENLRHCQICEKMCKHNFLDCKLFLYLHQSTQSITTVVQISNNALYSLKKQNKKKENDFVLFFSFLFTW